MKPSMVFGKVFSRSRVKKKSSQKPPTNVNQRGACMSASTDSSSCYENFKENGAQIQPEVIDWELRPGGMLVQRRATVGKANPSLGPLIKVKVSYGACQHEVSIPSYATFGDMKWILASEVGLKPNEQRLLFQGKEKDDNDFLHISGVKDMAKVILIEDPASKEKKLKEIISNQAIKQACQAVAIVRVHVDNISIQISALDQLISSGRRVTDHEFSVLTELLMQQLLELDTIEAEGEAKVQRRIEVRRVQSLTEHLDELRFRCSNPICNTATMHSSNQGTGTSRCDDLEF
ncbi:hypothetical protein KP509_33G041400 [Ceratopteris richardii]|uniref:Uncharacterized protein n=1 Tax=Ceratopteris richardii TaxID=49495 RepID=A0A8T2QQ27_CERRI|nr:hypothetical protein KP509_33G041400 [Ceratopteris richardii]